MKDIIDAIFNNIWLQRIFWSVVVIVLCLVLYSVISWMISRREKKNLKLISNKKGRTYLRMLKSTNGYILLIVAVLAILKIFGVDTSSMLAGVGIVGLVIGFAIQDALKDIIRGFDIVSDDYCNIGDVVTIGEITGVVVSTGIKTIKVKDIVTADIVSIANRNVDQVEVASGIITIEVPLPYELKVEKAEKIIDEIVKRIRKNDLVTDSKYLGVNDLADSAIKYLVEVDCNPADRRPVRRMALRTAMTTLEEHKISVPYNQLDVHAKK